MSVTHGNRGYAVPFILRDILSQSIAAANFDPTEDTPKLDKYCKHGFFVMPAEDLTLEVTSWDAYHNNEDSVVGLTPVSVFCSAGQWLACPIVYIGAESGKTVNLGII